MTHGIAVRFCRVGVLPRHLKCRTARVLQPLGLFDQFPEIMHLKNPAAKTRPIAQQDRIDVHDLLDAAFPTLTFQGRQPRDHTGVCNHNGVTNCDRLAAWPCRKGNVVTDTIDVTASSEAPA